MKIDAEQIRQVYTLAPAGILGHAVTLGLMSLVLEGSVSSNEYAGWLFGMLLVLVLRTLTLFWYQKTGQQVRPDFHPDLWYVLYLLGVAATGIGWGLSTCFAGRFEPFDYYLLLAAVGFGLAGTAITTLGTVFSLYLAFTLPMMALISTTLLLSGEHAHIEVGLAAVFGTGFLVFAAYRHSRQTRELIASHREVEDTQLEIILRLGKAGEYRDNDTGGHLARMSHSASMLARAAGQSDEFCRMLALASPMHDVGKIGIPDHILLKPGRLDPDEWKIMQTHAAIGRDILDQHDSRLLQMATSIAYAHHERWDGSGYPRGLAGEDIPLEARIVSICDVFDALTSERPYKTAWTADEAIRYIDSNAGGQFDPHLARVFVDVAPSLYAVGEDAPAFTVAPVGRGL